MRTKSRLERFLGSFSLFLVRLVVLSIAGGIVYGFWLSGVKEEAIEAATKVEKAAEAKEEALRAFSPDVIDPTVVLEYAESQRLKIEILGEALLAYKSKHGVIPAGDTWQAALVMAKTLKVPVLIDSLPIDITWARKEPPLPLLLPAIDSDGTPVVQLSAGGVVLATCRAGEIIVADQPIPDDAAIPSPDTRVSPEEFPETPVLTKKRASRGPG